MSAMPSLVTGSGASYSSILTPRARRSTSAALISGTRQASWVCVSEVPTGAQGHGDLTSIATPKDDAITLVLPEDLKPEGAVVEGATRVEIGRQKDGKDHVIAEHRCLLAG